MLEKSSSLDESFVVKLGSGFVSFDVLIFGLFCFLSIPEVHSIGVSIRKDQFRLSFDQPILKHSLICFIFHCQPSLAIFDVPLKRSLVDSPLAYFRKLSLLLFAFLESPLVNLILLCQPSKARLQILLEFSLISEVQSHILPTSFSFVIFEEAQIVKSLRVYQDSLAVDLIPAE